jgi:protocatechuate 3,4-dioxygenase beta subunit
MTTRRDLIAGLTASFAGALVTEARAQSRSTSCVLTPQTGEGPFYFDPKLVRSDIREGQAGVPLALDIRVVTANDCMPIAKARVDVWHADARGLYSGYTDQWGSGSERRSVSGKTFLRGTQFADEEGRVSFRTVYPSWYRGRTPHIHFKVILEPREVAVSQLYFDDKLSDKVFAGSNAYVARRRGHGTYNENDMFMSGGRLSGAVCEVTEEGDIYRASAVIGIADARS